MSNVSRYRAAAILVGSLAMGLVLGGGVIATGGSSSETPHQREGNDSTSDYSNLRKNDHGQLIGEYELDGPRPDLLPTTSDEGVEGFVYLSDLNPPPAKNPEEAIAINRKYINSRGEWVVPVYAEDGRKVLGQFTAGVVEEESGDSLED